MAPKRHGPPEPATSDSKEARTATEASTGGPDKAKPEAGAGAASAQRREFDVLREIYPNLPEEVEGLERAVPCGGIMRRAFECLDDATARVLDAKFKKQRLGEIKRALRRDSLTKEILGVLTKIVD